MMLFLIFLTTCGGTEDESTDEASDETGDDTGNGSSLTATLSSIQTEIFTPTCATSGCHSAGSASAGLSLASGSSFSNLVNVTSSQQTTKLRVKPGDPDNSYLINKLEGTGSGSRMPRGGSPLSSEQIQTIRDWITSGAENN